MIAAPSGQTEAGARLVPRALAYVDVAAAPLFAALAVALISRDQGGYFPTSWGWSTLALVAVIAVWLIARSATDMQRADCWFLLALVLFAVWVGLSISWSVDPSQSVLELERTLVLVAGCAGLLVLARKGAGPSLVLGLVVAIGAIGSYSLWTRLFPVAASFDPRDPNSGYRLFEPVGYWNSLGMFAGMGILLAFGLVTEPTVGRARRVVASLTLVILPLVLFFTFSRGSWLALGVGAVAAIALSPHRLRLLGQGAVLALPPAVAVVLASRLHALTDSNATLHAAQHQGHRFVLVVAALTAVSAALVPALLWLERRVHVDVRRRRALEVGLAGAVVLVLVAGIAAGGGPVSLARRGYDSFIVAAPPATPTNVTNRLFTLNGNGRAQMWHVAVDAVHGHWIGGTGAGSFERNWDRSPKANEVVRNAHGLYVEMLSEVGIVGLGLLVALLAIPLAAGLRVRRAALVAPLIGAYVTFVLHNAVDWDWQLSGLTLAGLFVGCLLLVARRDGEERPLAIPMRAAAGCAAAVVAAMGLVAALGNGALAHAQAEVQAKHYSAAARDASTAHTWMPWSAEPLKALGTAELEQRKVAAAQRTYRHATSVDPGDWQAWLDLAASVQGRARAQAVALARALYPTSPEIATFVEESRRQGP